MAKSLPIPNPLILRGQISRPWPVALAPLAGWLGCLRGSCLPQGRTRGRKGVALAPPRPTQAILVGSPGVALASPRLPGRWVELVLP